MDADPDPTLSGSKTQKKGKTTNFSPSFVIFVIFGLRDPGWIKIRIGIRDKHPRFTTLLKSQFVVRHNCQSMGWVLSPNRHHL
jgi:hypothetical protein